VDLINKSVTSKPDLPLVAPIREALQNIESRREYVTPDRTRID